MNTTRMIVVAMLIAGSGLASRDARATTGDKRTDALRHDLEVAGREVIQVRVAFAQGVAFGDTRIRARRSPMSSKARWNINWMARRR